MCEPNDFLKFNLRVFTFWFERESIIPGFLLFVQWAAYFFCHLAPTTWNQLRFCSSFYLCHFFQINSLSKALFLCSVSPLALSPTKNSVQHKNSAINVLRALLRLISGCHVHTPSQTLRSTSDTLSLQIPRARLSTVGSCGFLFFSFLKLYLGPLHGMNYPFLSDRNPLWTPSDLISRHSFVQNNRAAIFSAPLFHLPLPQVSVCCLFKLCVN